MPKNRIFERPECRRRSLKASLTDVTKTARQWDAIFAMRVHPELLGKYTVPNVADDDEGYYLVGALVQEIDAALEGRIPIVTAGSFQERETPRKAFARLQFLSRMPAKRRGWAASLLNLLRQLPGNRFSLGDAYLFEEHLARLFPENKNVRPKIRQQLQVLRDAGIIQFEARGRYKFIKGSCPYDSGSMV